VPSSSISTTHGGSSLKLTGVSISQANDLLRTSYQLYRHVKTNETIVRTLGYALPTALDGHVEMVAPTTSFESPKKQWQNSEPRKRFGRAVRSAEEASGEPVTVPSNRYDNRDFSTTPSFLSWMYRTWTYSPTAIDQNMLGIVGFNQQFVSPTDLALFLGKYRSDAVSATFTVDVVNGAYDHSNPGREANLDMQ
jgi:tripeptidyl-peptidase-1